MITYTVERWVDCRDDLKFLLPIHWAEIDNNQENAPFDPDYDAYQMLDNGGFLHLVLVRDDGRLIGYHSFVMRTHLHAKSTLMAFADVYYILPEYRYGRIGIKMFLFAESSLKDLGVKQIYNATTMKLNNGPIFKRLGYTHIEDVYVKELV